MKSYQYAAYGSNLHPIRLRKRVPSAKLVGTCLLRGYDLKFHKVSKKDGSGKCNVVPGEIGVYLAIFEVHESERGDLDKIEGLNYGYNAAIFETEEFGQCSSYVADPSAIDESQHPIDWYKEMVVLGCLANSFPSDYVQGVQDVSTIIDSDNDRAIEQWKIVEELRNAT